MDNAQQLLEFAEFFSSRVVSIKFTLEYNVTNISFLYVSIILKERQMHENLFKREKGALNIFDYSSAHPLSCKLCILYGQFLSVLWICSDISDFDINAIEMAEAFTKRGFLENLVIACLVKA